MSYAPWAVALLAVLGCLYLYGALRVARRKGDGWMARCNKAEDLNDELRVDCDYYRSLFGWLRGQSKRDAELPPDDLVIGTASNPIITPGDSARWSTLDEFCPRVLP